MLQTLQIFLILDYSAAKQSPQTEKDQPNPPRDFCRDRQQTKVNKKSTHRLILAKTFIIFVVENENIMQYDIIYPDDESHIQETPCVIAASYFDADELIGFGVNPDADEVHEPFIDDNEFEKIFKLWDSPLYLRKFYANNIEYFKQEYWDGITEDEFVRDVTHSLNEIRAKIINLFRNHNISTAVEPLEPKEADLRLYQSIRVKLKQGWIHNRFAFRFYAIEIEEKKCYLITGATIKIHKDMKKAPNTNIELEKLKYALTELSSNGVDTKELFFDFIL